MSSTTPVKTPKKTNDIAIKAPKPKDDVEIELERACFSADANLDFDNLLESDEDQEIFDDSNGDNNLFVIDTIGSRKNAMKGCENEKSNDSNKKFQESDDGNEKSVFSDSDEENGPKETEAPLWVDDDDANLKVNIRKTKRLRKLRSYEKEKMVDGAEFTKRLRKYHESGNAEKPSWATRKPKNEADSSILKSDMNLAYSSSAGTPGLLLPDLIDIMRCKNANVAEPQACPAQCVEFHPNSNILLVAGLDRTIRLFNIDGVHNEKIQSVKIEDLPISCAKFTADGKEIILSGKRQYFYVFDLENATLEKIHALHGRREKNLEKFFVSPCNKYLAFVGLGGSILLICRRTKQFLRELRMNTFVRDMCFSKDGKYLYSNGGNQQIYVWNMKSFTCESIFNDDGCIKGTALAVSNDLNCTYLAAGSDSGVVNVYKRDESSGTFKVTPEKALMNLTTFVDGIKFNCDNQLMVMYSSTLKNSLRLVHFPSLRVYSNWPTLNTPLKHVKSVSFSANGEFLAIGTHRGQVLLQQISHYIQH